MSKVYTHHFDTPLYKADVSVHTGLFINGKFVDSVDGETIDVLNPVTGKVITKVTIGSAKDVDIAVKSAEEAFKTSWGLKCPGAQRGKLLNRLADLVEKNLDELCALEALDAGKHFLHCKGGEIGRTCLDTIRYFAGWPDKHHGQTFETDESKFAYTRNEPIGVCATIVPWNFPLSTVVAKVAPALAAGCVIIIKPSELTPLSTLKFVELVREAGFPAGVVSLVNGYGNTVGQALVDHPRVRKIAFTGSTLTGKRIIQSAGQSNLKRVTLELGGKSPVLVFDDADLEQTIKWVSMGIFHHSGQMCVANSRIYVQEGIYDKFVAALSAVATGLRQGDGFSTDVDQGPLVSQAQLDRVLGYIESGKQEGARVLVGGTRGSGGGFFVRPTLFTDTKPDMRIVREEIFGPVGVVVKFKTEEEALAQANDTEYGLAAYVYTQDVNRAIRVSHALESGQAFVNSYGTVFPSTPFGGVKQSGQGKEMGEAALDAYTNVKTVHINLGLRI